MPNTEALQCCMVEFFANGRLRLFATNNCKLLFVIGTGKKSFHFETSGLAVRPKTRGKTLLNAENMLFEVCLSCFLEIIKVLLPRSLRNNRKIDKNRTIFFGFAGIDFIETKKAFGGTGSEIRCSR